MMEDEGLGQTISDAELAAKEKAVRRQRAAEESRRRELESLNKPPPPKGESGQLTARDRELQSPNSPPPPRPAKGVTTESPWSMPGGFRDWVTHLPVTNTEPDKRATQYGPSWALPPIQQRCPQQKHGCLNPNTLSHRDPPWKS